MRRRIRYEDAVDYKHADFEHKLASVCATGVDVYFDNTSGRISDFVLRHLAKRARVVICGTASMSSWDPWPQGPRVERHFLNKSARMQGFLIWNYEHRYNEAVTRLAFWIRSGQLRYREEILEGIEQAPDAIAGQYRGENMGKRVIRIYHRD
ncbi:MAG: zinc-binding dehydrogenase [Casimicrobiaceae bacterium]